MTKSLSFTGMDEAGRGCVLGPMVVAAFSIPAAREEELRELGVGDSKKITKKKRESLNKSLRQMKGVTIQVSEIPVAQINLRNLNDLTKEAVVNLSQMAPHGEIYLDVPAPPRGVAAYLEAIQKAVNSKDFTVKGDNKGEDKYLVVGAASIIAKVHRDKCLDDLRSEGVDFGSGYPSDPKTRKFLQTLLNANSPLPDFVRTRWKTVSQLQQKTLEW